MAALLLQCTTGLVTGANKAAIWPVALWLTLDHHIVLSIFYGAFRLLFNGGAILQRSRNICASAAQSNAKGADGCPSAPFSTRRRA